MKSRMDQTQKENQKIIAENQSLKTRIGQVEVNDQKRQQELIKQNQSHCRVRERPIDQHSGELKSGIALSLHPALYP